MSCLWILCLDELSSDTQKCNQNEANGEDEKKIKHGVNKQDGYERNEPRHDCKSLMRNNWYPFCGVWTLMRAIRRALMTLYTTLCVQPPPTLSVTLPGMGIIMNRSESMELAHKPQLQSAICARALFPIQSDWHCKHIHRPTIVAPPPSPPRSTLLQSPGSYWLQSFHILSLSFYRGTSEVCWLFSND